MFFRRDIWFFALMLVVWPLTLLFVDRAGMSVGVALTLAATVAATLVAAGLWATKRDSGKGILVCFSMFMGMIGAIWVTALAFTVWGPQPISFAVPVFLFVLVMVGLAVVSAGLGGGLIMLLRTLYILLPTVAVVAGLEFGYPAGPLVVLGAAVLGVVLAIVLDRKHGKNRNVDNLLVLSGAAIALVGDFLIAPPLATAWGWPPVAVWVVALPVLATVVLVPLVVLTDLDGAAKSYREAKAASR